MADRKDVIGKCYTYRGLKFYAQNGFVCLHDEDSGEFFVLTRREFLERAKALSDEAKKMRELSAANPAQAGWISSDRMDLQDGVEMMVAAAAEAKEQGDRTEPEVDAWFMRHRPNRKSRLSLASSVNFSTPTPGNLPLGKNTGKQVTPDFSVSPGQCGKNKLILPGEF